MARPSDDAEVPPEGLQERPELSIVEAGASRERTCAECGRRTSTWKPVRRKGTSVILCPDCARKPAPSEEGTCPSCGTPLRDGDRFCGRCGLKIEYLCPTCGAILDAEDAFCGKCGTRLG